MVLGSDALWLAARDFDVLDEVGHAEHSGGVLGWLRRVAQIGELARLIGTWPITSTFSSP